MSEHAIPRTIELEQVEQKELLPGVKVRFVHSDSMTVAYWEFEAGAVIPLHDHYHEQIANLTEGEFELTVDGTPILLQPGIVVVIPGGVPHSGKAITASRIIDIFHPVREDYR